MKAIFISQQNPTYDDFAGVRYHFPKSYLKRVEAAVGDSIIYYESGRIPGQSSRKGKMSYFGVAQVVSVRPDLSKADFHYADLREYLPFDSLVPLKVDGQYLESSLNGQSGGTSGNAQAAVRHLSNNEFETILSLGFSTAHDEPYLQSISNDGFAEPPQSIIRPKVIQIYERPFRDRVFTKQIQSAYDKRCALTGLRIINGGGRPEAQAAHIRPVEENGPDLVQNGLALSSTVHWMFDRGLISIDDDLRILKSSRHVPPEVDNLLNKSGFILPPSGTNTRPHPTFLKWHRENRFKG
jgi:putative restriction endonuclease